MPLLRRTQFPLLEPPTDLDPKESVFQVRFTKEIFRDYQQYLNRLNLYRQRFWTCKSSGKTNLTYEEALVSEQRAIEKVQHFPKDLMPTVLRAVQFSMLPLKDLMSAIAAQLQDCLLEGDELYGKKDNCMHPCKIVKILNQGSEKTRYKVGWLDKDKQIIETTTVSGEDLIRKKLPFTRDVLKSFIRESTYRSVPWIIHDELARKHGISTDPPEELKSQFGFQDGKLLSSKKRKKDMEDGQNDIAEEAKEENGKRRRKKVDMKKTEEKEVSVEPIKYPIDDLLVKPSADDPVFTDLPSPSREFNVPMDCVGDLIMVWDFFTSFGRLLQLSPFSLEDFENAVCHRESNLSLIVESHSSILRLLIKEEGEYSLAVHKKRQKPKITTVNWTEYLSDFIEMSDITELSSYIPKIKRGNYHLLETGAKLEIFRELVAEAIETDLFREKVDEIIEERHALASTKHGELLEERRQQREEKHIVNDHGAENGNPAKENAISSGQNHASEESESKKKATKKNVKVTAENGKDDKKEAIDKKSKEQRKEYLEREIEKRFVRANSLGKDKHYNRYWFFRRDGRIFVESSDSKEWGYYSTKEELDALFGSLNIKGERERALQRQLNKSYQKICGELLKRSKELAQKIALDEAVLRRSTRVRAPSRDDPALAYLRYVNKWKDN